MMLFDFFARIFARTMHAQTPKPSSTMRAFKKIGGVGLLDRIALEAREQHWLAPHATFSDRSSGRAVREDPCPLRTEFMRDRDRIIHSKSFRRLKHKTQVFLSPEGDHYRTRLTHTLEVAQIGRTIARSLRLNEDLAEAIALGHDLGHTPFGHSGEQVLDEISSLGFTHSAQSLRLVDVLERGMAGLNLTQEVRDGILCHSEQGRAGTPEGRLVYWADKIAYVNHDIDDAIRAGVLQERELPASAFSVLGSDHSERINTMVHSLVEGSHEGTICMTSPVFEAFTELRDFLFENVYYNPAAKTEEYKAKQAISFLYAHYVSNPDQLPFNPTLGEDREDSERAVLDFISGMTDRYCISVFEDLFVPKMWRL